MTKYSKEAFLDVYNKRADDIFAYCYEKTAHREVAKYLTRNIFMKTWDTLALAGAGVRSIERTLYRTAKDIVASFSSQKESQNHYRDNLWNLTLSQ